MVNKAHTFSPQLQRTQHSGKPRKMTAKSRTFASTAAEYNHGKPRAISYSHWCPVVSTFHSFWIIIMHFEGNLSWSTLVSICMSLLLSFNWLKFTHRPYWPLHWPQSISIPAQYQWSLSSFDLHSTPNNAHVSSVRRQGHFVWKRQMFWLWNLTKLTNIQRRITSEPVDQSE